jgi:hypothetical protein
LKPYPYKPWARGAAVKPRCRLCQIVLVDGHPPTPCFRPECRFARGGPTFEPVSLLGSTLAGGDYSEAG